MQLETDTFLTAVREVLISATTVAELTETNVVVWHHGSQDPDEDISAACAKCQDVAVLIYDLGGTGDGADADIIRAEAAVELYVQTTKRNRRRVPDLRRAGEIRDSIMQLLHRHTSLRNTAAFFDCRVRGYQPLLDPEFTAFRIKLTRFIYLDP